jgi:hypothetical protein
MVKIPNIKPDWQTGVYIGNGIVAKPKTSKTESNKMQNRQINEIAAEIKSDWKKVNFGAVPYLDAMQSINSINEYYGLEDARSVVAYFLSNATTWRGETARRIKKELKDMMQ